MHYCYQVYAWYFYFGGQRSLRGHFRFGARKFQEFFLTKTRQNGIFKFKLGQCIFLQYICIFLSRSKVIQGSKGQICFSNDQKISLISNCKNKSVIVFYMDRDTKLSTVTSSSDLPLRVQRSKKVKTRTISNGKTNSAYVFHHHGQRCKSVHGDLFVLPTVKGSKVKGHRRLVCVLWSTGLLCFSSLRWIFLCLCPSY